MTQFRLLSVFALFASFSCASASEQWLVTPEEAEASRAAPPPLLKRNVPAQGAPAINVVSPSLGAPVPSPTRIQVRFEPTPPASIKPDSFKVRYGALKIDITGRITAASKVTAEGIDVAQASLPKGNHRLFIEIQDSMGRTSERQVQFSVD